MKILSKIFVLSVLILINATQALNYTLYDFLSDTTTVVSRQTFVPHAERFMDAIDFSIKPRHEFFFHTLLKNAIEDRYQLVHPDEKIMDIAFVGFTIVMRTLSKTEDGWNVSYYSVLMRPYIRPFWDNGPFSTYPPYLLFFSDLVNRQKIGEVIFKSNDIGNYLLLGSNYPFYLPSRCNCYIGGNKSTKTEPVKKTYRDNFSQGDMAKKTYVDKATQTEPPEYDDNVIYPVLSTSPSPSPSKSIRVETPLDTPPHVDLGELAGVDIENIELTPPFSEAPAWSSLSESVSSAPSSPTKDYVKVDVPRE